MTLAVAVEIGRHLADCPAGIERAEPCGDVRMLIVQCLFLLHVDQNHWHIEILDGGKHIVGRRVRQQLQDDEIHIGRAELLARRLRLLLRRDESAVDELHRAGERLLERLILPPELRNELRELRQICPECNGENATFAFVLTSIF